MSAAELLLAAAGEVREANQAELAEAAANAAYLLGCYARSAPASATPRPSKS
jgi:hypothetical protein